MQKVGIKKKIFARSAREIDPHFQNRGVAPVNKPGPCRGTVCAKSLLGRRRSASA